MVSLKCDGIYIVLNETVYTNNYQFNFTYDRSRCKLYINAVNPSGHSARVMKSIKKRYKGNQLVFDIIMKLNCYSDPEYILSDFGVNFFDGYAHLYFNVTVSTTLLPCLASPCVFICRLTITVLFSVLIILH